jgi:hypothetical protein
MADAQKFLFLFVLTTSVNMHGMNNNLANLCAALETGNSESLKAITTNSQFDPNFHLNTTLGCMDLFAYLVWQTFPDDSKTCELATILYNAGVHITLPSETTGFTVFHHIKSNFLFDFFIKKANITNPKNLLDTDYHDGKETLFLKLIIQQTPFEEIKKIYNRYKPNLHFETIAGGTILHHLLAFYLVYNLEAQLYCTIPFEQMAHAKIAPKDMYRLKKKYNYVEETVNKFKFFVEHGNINPHAKNKYAETAYEFYSTLQKTLHTDNLDDYLKAYPEYENFLNILACLKKAYVIGNINLENFFQMNAKLEELIIFS